MERDRYQKTGRKKMDSRGMMALVLIVVYLFVILPSGQFSEYLTGTKLLWTLFVIAIVFRIVPMLLRGMSKQMGATRAGDYSYGDPRSSQQSAQDHMYDGLTAPSSNESVKICPYCGEVNKPSARECRECHQPLA